NLVITSSDVSKTLTAIEGLLPNPSAPPPTVPTTYAKDTLGLDTGYVISMASDSPIKLYHQVSTLSGVLAQTTLVSLPGISAGAFNMSIGGTTQTFTIDTTTTAQGLLNSINQAFPGLVTAKLTAGSFDILGTDPTLPISFSSDTSGFVAAASFQPVNDPTINVYELIERIRQVPGVDVFITTEGKLRIQTDDGQDLIITDLFNVTADRQGYVASALGIAGAATNGSSIRRAYAAQFNEILVQINRFIINNDAGYRGVNLLNGQDLTVNFNDDRTSNLVVSSVVFSTDGLGLRQAFNNWVTREDVERALLQIDGAMIRIRAQSSEFGQNLSTIQNREDFARSMVNVLNTGADALVLADMDEEAANLLSLQLRQQLATNALAMASTSAQSVLRLFG
ncbi:MAG: hypothetical protein FWF01_04375, partial [Alphaproteobacteria bacterium]|nr:hypothetical protein [Alphaproteobacteria bacterium]